jgi:hypothetical protein
MKNINIFLFIVVLLIVSRVFSQEKKDLSQSSDKSYVVLGGENTEGSLLLNLYNNTNMQVFRYNNGLWIHQWYGECSKSIWLYADENAYSDSCSYYKGNSIYLKTISNIKINSNTSELILEKAGKIRIKQITYYPPGSDSIYYKWEITNLSDSLMKDLRFFTGGDTYLNNSDDGAGYWQQEFNAIGVKKIFGSYLKKLYIQGYTQPHAYESRNFYDVYHSIVDNELINAIDTSVRTDNALAMEFLIDSLDKGSTWTINALESFKSSLISNLIVTAPLSANIEQGSFKDIVYTIENRKATSTMVTLLSSSDLAGWTTQILYPEAPFCLKGNDTQEVCIRVYCPENIPLNTKAMITLTAIDNSGSANDFCNITVVAEPTIVLHPFDQAVCKKNAAQFKICAENVEHFQWQKFDTIWRNITDNRRYTGSNSDCLILSAVSSNMNNNKYRCIVSNSYGSLPSNSASLTVYEPATVNDQPLSLGICEENDAYFQITASGEGLSYQWQINAGYGFFDLVDEGLYKGSKTRELYISNVPINLNGCEFRCLVGGLCGSHVFSDSAELIVYRYPDVMLGNDTILKQYQTITLDAGPGTSYSWSLPGLTGRIVTIDFNKIGAGTTNISVEVANKNECTGTDTIAITYLLMTNTNSGQMPNSVQLTPNPTSGSIIIIFPTLIKEADITLQNIDGGNMLKKKLYNVSSSSIDLSSFKGGTYILKVISDNQTAFFKVVVI